MPKKLKFQDIIADIDIDIPPVPTKPKPIVEPTNDVEDISSSMFETTSRGEVIRDKKGRFMKGTGCAYSISKANIIKKELAKILGPNVIKALHQLEKIITYDPDSLEEYKDKEGNIKYRKRRSHFYSASTQLAAITLALKYFYGNPRSEITIDQTVDVKVEKKIADLTKLINENHEKLKVIEGGKEE